MSGRSGIVTRLVLYKRSHVLEIASKKCTVGREVMVGRVGWTMDTPVMFWVRAAHRIFLMRAL